MPVSWTSIRTRSPSGTTHTRTPPVWVNFTAFDTRFSRICFSFVRSVCIVGTFVGTSREKVSPFFSSIGSTCCETSAITVWMPTSSRYNGILPASILARSRMPLISSSRW